MPIIGIQSSAGMKPSTPTIGTASDGGTGTTVSVAFTPSTYIGKGTITYTALSNPGSITATGSGSPITVSGLTTGTAYTFTVKGDTNYGVASDYSAASNSVTPSVPSSFDSIATVTGSGQTSITFSSIPSTYKTLQIRASSIATNEVALRFNGSSAASYQMHTIYAAGSANIGGTKQLGNTQIKTSNVIFGASSTQPTAQVIDIIDYASSSKNKVIRYFTGVGQGEVDVGSGAWLSTTAINSITLVLATGNFAAGSSVALYGIK